MEKVGDGAVGARSDPRKGAALRLQLCKLLQGCSLGIKFRQTDLVHKNKVQVQADTSFKRSSISYFVYK